jgi:thioesterase domain-containing protein
MTVHVLYTNTVFSGILSADQTHVTGGKKMLLSGFLEKIKPYDTLGMKLANESDDSIVMTMLLDENINDKSTMFAGSIYSVMVLCGWALAFKTFNSGETPFDAVIKKSVIEYVRPVKTDAAVTAKKGGDVVIKRNGNKSLRIEAELQDSSGCVCAVFDGEYVGIRKPSQ